MYPRFKLSLAFPHGPWIAILMTLVIVFFGARVGHPEVIGDPNGTALLTVEKVMENVPLDREGQPLFSACDTELAVDSTRPRFHVDFPGAPDSLCSQGPQLTGTTLVRLTPDPRSEWTTYEVSEQNMFDPLIPTFSGDCAGSTSGSGVGEVRVVEGEHKTCTVTNTFVDQSEENPTAVLEVVTVVDNSAGGTKTACDVMLSVTPENRPGVSFPAVPAEMCGQGVLNPTTWRVYVGLSPYGPGGSELFTIGEVSDPALTGYVTTCSGVGTTGNKVSLAPGQHKTCVVTIKYVGPEVIGDPNGTALLTVEKVMENVPRDREGQPLFSVCDTELAVDSTRPQFHVDFPGAPDSLCSQGPQMTGTTLVRLTPDPRSEWTTYEVSEQKMSDPLIPTFSGDCAGSTSGSGVGEVRVVEGEHKTCTVTNTFVDQSEENPTAVLEVVTVVDNSAGGTKTACDVMLSVTPENRPGVSFPAVPAEMCGQGVLNPTTWRVYVGLSPYGPGGSELFTIGEVSDPALTGYVTTCSGVGTTGNKASLAPGQHKTCVVTIKYVGPEVIGDPNGTALLTVEKVMENVPLDREGQPLFSACDTELAVDSTRPRFHVDFPGAPDSLCSQGPQLTGTTLVRLTPDPRSEWTTYEVSEQNMFDPLIPTFSGDCAGSTSGSGVGEVRVVEGEHKTCTVTNTFVDQSEENPTAVLEVVTVVDNSAGGTKTACDVMLSVTPENRPGVSFPAVPAEMCGQGVLNPTTWRVYVGLSPYGPGGSELFTIGEVSDPALTGYVTTCSGVGTTGNKVSLAPGQHKTCVVTIKCVPFQEVCDGLDNDCDGLIDEGGVCGGGGCIPLPEVCDGVDNDCDGLIDEGGVCAGISITDLGTLGGNESSATDINDSGHIVGYSETSSGETHAFLIKPEDNDADGNPDTWYSGTNGINDLMIDLGTLGGAFSYAIDINNSAQVVGWSRNLSDESHAFLWKDLNANGQSDAGEMIDLGTLPDGTMSTAYGINDSGQVVGRSNVGGSPLYEFHAVLWQDSDSDGQYEIIDLGALGGNFAEAKGINNLWQVVGISETSFGEQHAFLLTPDGDTWYRDTNADGANDLILDLGTLSLPDSAAMAINDVSQVVGWIRSLLPVDIRPFLWTAESGMREIGTFGGPISLAMDINDLGQVVGYSDVQASGDTHAFVWTENGGMIDLGTLGGPYSSASEINETGEHIVGSAETSAGERHAVLWTIIPNTPVGLNTEEEIGNVTITFDNVQTAGLTTVAESVDNPGFSLCEGYAPVGLFYEVTTTAIFTGNVTVCLSYEDPSIDVNTVSLRHCKDGSCEDVTTSRTRDGDIITICGSVSSFSWFVLGVPILVTEPVGLQPPLAPVALAGEEIPYPDKAFTQGRTLPMKLQMFSQEGTLLTDADVEAPPQILGVTREGDAIDLETVDIDSGEANDSGPYFRYSDGNWVYNFSTKDLSTGTFSITLEMPDGRSFVTGFVLK